MPAPLAQDQYVNELLTGVSVAYLQDKANFAAFSAAPIVPVKLQTSIFAKYTKDDWMRIKFRKRADGDVAAEGGYKTDNTNTYHCDVWALRKPIPPQVRANTVQPYNADRDATLWLTQQSLLNREQRFADACLATSKWGNTDQAGVASAPSANQFVKWSAAGSTPIQDIRAKITLIGQLTGRKPNELVIGEDVKAALTDHADFVDRLKYTSQDSVDTVLIAKLLGLRRVTVSSAAVTTLPDGEAVSSMTTSNTTYVAGGKALLLYVEDSPGPLNPSAAVTMSWVDYLAGDKGGCQISQYRVQERKTDFVEAEQAFVVQIMASDLGQLFTSCI